MFNFQNWAIRPVLLAVTVVGILGAGFSIALDQLLDWQVKKSIERSAAGIANEWSDRLFRSIPDAELLFSKQTSHLVGRNRLYYAIAIAEIMRFELFDTSGNRTFISNHGTPIITRGADQTALRVYETGKPEFIMHDDDTDKLESVPHTYIEAYVPAITPTGERIGTLELFINVEDLEDTLEDAFQQVSWILIFGTLFVMAIPGAAYIYRSHQLHRMDRELLELTRYDQLTGILNRNSVSEQIDPLFDEQDFKGQIGILFVDVDRFKQVNDQYGHACGDKLLKHIAGILTDSIEEGDIVGRYGGDEFIILCPNTSLNGIRTLYCKIMEGAKEPCTHENYSYAPSLSVGAYLASHGDTAKMAIHRADLAVYSAKRNGRGQVVEYTKDLEGLFDEEQFRRYG